MAMFHWILDFFFSYQVSPLFFSNDLMNNESNERKLSNGRFYVTWRPWCHLSSHLSVQTVACKLKAENLENQYFLRVRTETVNFIEINSHLTKVDCTKMLHELYFFVENIILFSHWILRILRILRIPGIPRILRILRIGLVYLVL